MRIDRCVCFNETFADLKAEADANECRTLPELQQHVTFGRKCKMCHPYVQTMLRTGETHFNRVIQEDDLP
jgi:NAD(P)H-nitrite reductase large subunit